VAIAVAAGGVWLLTQGPELSRFIRDNSISLFGNTIGRDTLRSLASPLPGVLMVVGVIQLLASVGVFAHKSWGRWLGVLLSLLGVIVGIVAASTAFALASGVSVGALVAVVILLGYAFALIALLAGGSHFKRRYQAPR
jgi:hypothetical protein